MSCLHGMYSSSACALCVAPVNIARNREEYELEGSTMPYAVVIGVLLFWYATTHPQNRKK
jgi:hypothetical protein